MFSSWKIAKLFGTNVQIHWTFWLLPAWIILTAHDSAFIPLWMHLLAVAALFVCVVMHEFGHILTARQFGIRTRTITLSPLGGIAHLDRMSNQPWEEFCIAVAGPLVNVAIAVFLGFGMIGAQAIGLNLERSLLMRFLGVLLFLNIGMILFNMIPAFPMDGGRVLRAILAHSMGLLEGTRVAVGIGTVAAICMGLAGAFLLQNPWLILIAMFVVFTGMQELRALEMQVAEGNGETAMSFLPRSSGTHVTVCFWDPQRQQWVRRTFEEPAPNAKQ
jgi:Zn-dependent protease